MPGPGVSLWTGTPLRGTDEDVLLARVLPSMPRYPDLVVPPGDDAAVLRTTAATVATTDTMVLGRDWRDDWSAGADVGHKIVTANLADVAAMGARPVGILVTLVLDPEASVEWVIDFSEGLSRACRDAGVSVLGGDLSSAPADVAMVSVTALGAQEAPAVLRSGACVGDAVAVCGSLGRAAAGLLVLAEGLPDDSPAAALALRWQRRPESPLAEGPRAALAGATSMMDVSDGLLRDAGRIGRASGVVLDLSRDELAPFVDSLAAVVGPERALRCVLTGGEEHSLLATFPEGGCPPGWVQIGRVRAASMTADAAHGAVLDGRAQSERGWDHFGGPATSAG